MNLPQPEMTPSEESPLSSPQTPTSPSSSKKSGFLRTFFIVIALILFGVLLGVLAARFLPLPASTQTPTPTPTPSISITPTPTVDETADWSTYTNSTYGYSFKHPKEWTLEVDPKSKEKEFSLTLKLGEIVTGTIFDGVPKGKITDTQKEFALTNNKYLLVVYAQCLGPGCGLGSLDLPTFTKFLTTFNFSDTTANLICPSNGWVDCMPVLDAAKTTACSTEAMAWYKANCPNFKGAAL